MEGSNIRRISLWAGPGSGKSCTAAGLYFELSKLGYDVELVREFIKEEMVYKGLRPDSFDQMWIFGNQMHREEKSLRHNKIIVTDSPLLLSVVYATMNDSPSVNSMIESAAEFEAKYPSLNIFLSRQGIPYKSNGRYQSNMDDAVLIDLKVQMLLAVLGVKYESIPTVKFDSILSHIVQQIRGDSDEAA